MRRLCARPSLKPQLTDQFGIEMTTFKMLYPKSSPSPVKQMHHKYVAIVTAEALSIVGIALFCYSLRLFIR